MNRFLTTTALALSLAGCSSSGTVTPAQVAADLTGLVNTLKTVVPQVEKAAPNALTPSQQTALANDLMNAQAALVNFSAGIPAAQGASQAQVIDGYINDVISTAAGVAPPPYNTAFVAAEVILPEIEAFVNQYLPQSFTQTIASMFTPTPAPKMGAALAMTPDQARVKLGIPIVHQ